MNVREWLAGLGLEEHAGAFEANAIAFGQLPTLTERDLAELGLPIGHRKQLIEAIATLAAATAPVDVAAFPSLVALALDEYLHESHPVARLWHACDTIELLLRLLVMAGIGELQRLDPLPVGLLGELKQNIEAPTLGKWKAMAAAVGVKLESHASAGRTILPELPGFVGQVLVPFLDGAARPRTAESSFLELRNRLAHGAGVTRVAAANLLTRWAPRFEEVLRRASWLGELRLLTQLPDGSPGLLRGPVRQAVPWSEAAEAGWTGHELRDRVVLLRRDQRVELWPLLQYGVPRDGGASQPVAQVYQRRGEVSLDLTPLGSDEVCQSASDDSALASFLRLFRLDEHEVSARATVRDFWRDLRTDADRLVGRQDELRRVAELVRTRSSGLLWLTGAAGIGKSYLVASAAVALQEEPPEGALVLPYRFKAGDDRCLRARFLEFAIERLTEQARQTDVSSGRKRRDDRRPEDELRALLERAATRRVIFVLDGLDELPDGPRFVREVPVALSSLPGVLWLCAGRPEPALMDAFTAAGAHAVFPGGLPPMGVGDVREMLLQKSGNLRRRLVAGDRDQGDAVVNPFIEKVARLAEGLPIYVKYVVGDILENRYRALDGGERLPASLAAYHEELLRRCTIGALQQLLTPLAALLALAREPLTVEALADLLARGNVITADEGRALVQRGLAAIAPTLRRATAPDRGDGFTLFHHSLRQHMEQSPDLKVPLATRRADLARFAATPGPGSAGAARYLYRWGVTHLIEAREAGRAVALLTSFPWLMDRLALLSGAAGVRAVLEDLRRVAEAGPLDDAASAWQRFFRGSQHLLEREDDAWPTERLLLQVAADHATGHPVTVAAEAWLAEGRCGWPWLRTRPADRPRELALDACLGVLDDHRGPVHACALSASGAVGASGGGSDDDGDYRIRLWDVERLTCTRVWSGHTDEVRALALSADGRGLASGGLDGTIRLWDASSETCIGVIEAHAGGVFGLALSGDGARLYSCGADGAIREWERSSATLLRTFGGGAVAVRALALDPLGRFLVSGSDDGRVLRWALDAGGAREGDATHARPVRSVAVSPDGRQIVSGGQDGDLRCWDLDDLSCTRVWGGMRDAVSSVTFLPDSRRVLATCAEGDDRRNAHDPTLQLWDASTGVLLARLRGHFDNVHALALGADGARALSAAGDGTLRLWDLRAGGSALGASGCVYSVDASADGRLRVAANEDGSVALWADDAVEPHRRLTGHTERVFDVALFPCGDRLVSGSEDGTIRVWDVRDGSCLLQLRAYETLVDSVAASPDGSKFATTPGSTFWQPDDWVGPGHVKLWSASTGRCLWETAVAGDDLAQRYLCFLPDGRHLVAARDDRTVGLFEVRSGAVVRSFAVDDVVQGVKVTVDGRGCLIGVLSGKVHHFDLRTGARLATFSEASVSDGARALAQSADGRLLFVGGEDQRLRCFTFASGRLLASASLPAWVLSARALGAGHSCWVGLVDGCARIVELLGAEPPGTPIVSAAQLEAAPAPTAPCPSCGARFELVGVVAEALREAGGCLELPDAAWADPRLRSACTRCGHPVQLNPFVAGA